MKNKINEMRREGKIMGEREERKDRDRSRDEKRRWGHHSISLIAFHWYYARLAGPSALSLQKHPHCNTVGLNMFLKRILCLSVVTQSSLRKFLISEIIAI